MLPKQNLLTKIFPSPFLPLIIHPTSQATILTIIHHSISSLSTLPNYRKPHTLQILLQFLFPKSRRTAPERAIAWRRFACRQAEHQYLRKPGLFIPTTESILFPVLIPITYVLQAITIHI